MPRGIGPQRSSPSGPARRREDGPTGRVRSAYVSGGVFGGRGARRLLSRRIVGGVQEFQIETSARDSAGFLALSNTVSNCTHSSATPCREASACRCRLLDRPDLPPGVGQDWGIRLSRVGHPQAPFPPRKYTRPFEAMLETVTKFPMSATSPNTRSTCSTT